MSKTLGKVKLGWRWIEIIADPLMRGGEVAYVPKGGVATMTLGMTPQHSWEAIHEALMHETLEAAMEDLELSFISHGHLSRDGSSRWFVMTHERFAEVAARSAQFLETAKPLVWNEWRRQCKQASKKRKAQPHPNPKRKR